MRSLNNKAIPEPCTTMEIAVVPQVWNSEANSKTLFWKVFFKPKYTEINEEKVTKFLQILN